MGGVEVGRRRGEGGWELEIGVGGGGCMKGDGSGLYVVEGIGVDEVGRVKGGEIECIEVLKDGW